MDNNQFNSFVPQGGNSNSKKILGFVGLGLTSLGCLLTIIFSIIVCNRGLKVYEGNLKKAAKKGKFSSAQFGMSLWIIGVIIAILLVIAGIVLTILSIDKAQKLNKIVMVSLAVGVFALVYAIFSNVTICSYNCSLNSNFKKQEKKFAKEYDFDFDDFD